MEIMKMFGRALVPGIKEEDEEADGSTLKPLPSDKQAQPVKDQSNVRVQSERKLEMRGLFPTLSFPVH